MKNNMRRVLRVAAYGWVFFAFGITAAAYADNPNAIPNQPDAQPVPEFVGSPAVANPVSAMSVPQNPFMGSNPWNCIHNDSYMSDTYPVPGPLGRSPKVLSTWLGDQDSPLGIAVVMTFDRDVNRLIAAAVTANFAQGMSQVQLKLIDPDTLATLDSLPLPPETFIAGKFRPSGAYFFADQDQRTIIGTADRTIWVIYHTASTLIHNEADVWSLRDAIPDGDSIQALQPDWSGRLWFTSKGGVVGTLDMDTGTVIGVSRDLHLQGERIVNGHAADEDGGVYIVSTQAMYRFDADSDGNPVITWREAYDAGTHEKAGQVDIGSGTTPTLMGTDYVAITDNGQPRMHVLVYRRGMTLTGPRLACAEPVFQPGQASNENSVIATEKSIIVENNFGYRDPLKDTTHGHTTKPGMARIDLDENGACQTVWTNDSVSIPSLVSKLSLANGLIYTYTKPKGPATTDPWYFTAIDFHTGATVFKQLAGTGTLYDNNYAAAYVGPNGMLYVGVNGGIVAMRDGE
jgi:hypothetical protein